MRRPLEAHRGGGEGEGETIVRLRRTDTAAGTSYAFEELLSANLDTLYRTALRLCNGRAADAEDLLQDAMLRAFGHRQSLRDPATGRSWLFTILVRTNLNRARANGRRPEESASDMSDGKFEQALAAWQPAERPDEWLERDETQRSVSEALEMLDDDLRSVVVLHELEGFSYREVSSMLEVPEGTVASRLFRARQALRAALSAVSDGATTDAAAPRAAGGGMER